MASPGRWLTTNADWRPLVVIVVLFVAMAALVNPFRATPVSDDCAYAWTVQHLLATGEYRLHNWVAPNMPFQAYWGAAFATCMPEIFGALRVSTLPWSLAALLAFYGLARECRIDRRSALLLTLALFGSYLFFCQSFTFMTDIPAVALALLALLCFAAALRKNSLGLACLGAAAACGGVLTRQSCLAVPVGLALAALVDRQRETRWQLYAVGTLVPFVVFAWSTTLANNFAAVEHNQQMLSYVSNYGQLPREGFWRLNEVLLCCAVLLLPFTVVFVLRQCWRFMEALRQRRLPIFSLWMTACGVLASLSAFNYYTEVKRGTLLLPHLDGSYHEYFDGWLEEQPVNEIVTRLAFVGAAAFWPTLLRYCRPGRTRSLLPGSWLMESYAIVSVGFLLIFPKMVDRYTIPLLPVLLLILGRAVQTTLRQPAVAAVLGFALFAVLTLHALQTGAKLRLLEASWQGCQLAHDAGVPVHRIIGSDEWVVYHSFDEFIADYRRGKFKGDYFQQYFGKWLPDHFNEALADVRLPEKNVHRWIVLTALPCRDTWFRERHVQVLLRPDVLMSRPPGALPGPP